MTRPYEELRQEVLDTIQRGDPKSAFHSFRWVLHYPDELRSMEHWSDAWEVFAKIATAMGATEMAARSRAISCDPEDVKSLYELGYDLIEERLHSIAATVLARAHELVPNSKAILSELIYALEGDGQHAEACRYLRGAWDVPGRRLVAGRFIFRYFLAYNSLMTGDLSTPRKILPSLDPGDDRDNLLSSQLEGMVRRADAITAATPLDKSDLRGWHFVTTGTLLLHLSPHDAGGRYAWVWDRDELCCEGIIRLKDLLDAWSLKPPRVFALPDRASRILAHAAARLLGLPVEPWPEQGSGAPGLIVAYDLRTVDGDLVESLQEHRPGQILWSHAASWTDEPPFAADIVTYLYQLNVPPWEPGLRLDPVPGRSLQTRPREGSNQELAESIANMVYGPECLTDRPDLLKLAAAARTLTGEHAAGVFRTAGRRRRQRLASPVVGARFV
jgi:hypothetical protein